MFEDEERLNQNAEDEAWMIVNRRHRRRVAAMAMGCFLQTSDSENKILNNRRRTSFTRPSFQTSTLIFRVHTRICTLHCRTKPEELFSCVISGCDRYAVTYHQDETIESVYVCALLDPVNTSKTVEPLGVPVLEKPVDPPDAKRSVLPDVT